MTLNINIEAPCISAHYTVMKMAIRFKDSDELPDIRLDTVFKAVFTRNTPESQGALSDLISTFIERKVVVASIVTNEPPVTDIRDRSIRYDISCRTKNDELVNIEMSFRPDSFEPLRLEYYAGKLFTRQGIRGAKRNYSDLKDAYQIAILANGCFFDDKELVHSFQYYDPKHNVSLGGKSRIITIELKKAELVLEKPVAEMAACEAWALFFQYLTDRDKREKINDILEREDGIAMAGEALINITQDDIDWARQLSEEKYICDTQSFRVTAMREGEQIGLQKGRLEALQEAARNFKANGVSVDIIAKSTGLSPEEINLLSVAEKG